MLPVHQPLSTDSRYSISGTLIQKALRFVGGLRGIHRAFRRPLARRLIIFTLVASLVAWPGAPASIAEIAQGLKTLVEIAIRPLATSPLFSRTTPPVTPRITPRERLADRLAHVNRLSVSPPKLVAYEEQTASFSARPLDPAGETIQGVRVSWESSDPERVQVDETGRVRMLGPGLAWIIARAGQAEARAPILIRPGRKPIQTDQEWRADQAALRRDGRLAATAARVSRTTPKGLASLIDKLLPTAHAFEDAYTANDLLYDEL